ncbi:putative RNA methyltransferase [Desulfosarcina ovata subsp. sediminis]|uniref:Putative RNA methyltransferase n=1 Tax=Desulfosarcina ovata subsp. sediminis TaxID=885957 RepID=A0A5K7ZGB1_9BACT|nr:23S rRNA (uracil(1939)-C(5))-methyltransferase RlmD [Desulfosarcina ovata]BBO80374.1 putative RNA methyltransferase [Desulfosarcina ovata subsp. sediminis]
MSIKKKQIVECDVTDVAFGGKGLAKIDGFAVFIDQTVTGDRVAARIIRKKRNYAEAVVQELLRPSPLRVTAPCPYSGYCGGCKWQFIDYAEQIALKRQHVVDCLVHIALIDDATVHETIPSERIFGYRNKMEFSCSDRRWLMPHELGTETDMGFALGLHVPGTFHKVLDTRACLLQPEPGNQILEAVRELMRASRRPVYGLRSHEGFWRFLMLRHSVARDQWMVNVVTSEEDRDAVAPLVEMIGHRFPQVTSVINNITAKKSGVAIGEKEILLAGEPVLRDGIGSYAFDVSANSFFQTNTRGAKTLYDTVAQYADLDGNESVVDLYCGTGTIAIWLASHAREIIGLELVESAVADARKNCMANGIDNCRFILGDIKETLASIPAVPDMLVIDPPRIGMHKDVVTQVLAMAPPSIVYVSCNPATLARDMISLKEIYALKEVQPVDMFPHTFHVESVARLVKR